MAVSLNGHFELNSGGAQPLLMGAKTSYPIEQVSGLWDVPQMRTQDRPLMTADGGYAGYDFMEPREVTLGFAVVADPETSTYETLIENLVFICQPRSADYKVTFQRFGVVRHFYARPRGLSIPQDDSFHLGLAKGALRLWASDPTIYSGA
jgi:hypothetical protein